MTAWATSPPSPQAATLRANPRYALVLAERLAPAERRLLGDADREADLYGVLRPAPGSGLELRSASSDTALLFLTLGEPGPLPAYVAARLGDEAGATVGRLVLDGVLEIEHEGEYVCGTAAAERLMSGRADGGRGRIGDLSCAALRYGQELAGLPEPLLAMRLYCYGRRPLSAELRRTLVDEESVAAHMGLGPGGSAREALDAGWVEVAPARGHTSHWRRWRPRHATRRAPDPGAPAYKLYVSPTTEAIEAALGAVASALASARGVSAFKVGRDVPGICRPDKLVVYFERLDDLQAAAAVLRERLAGHPADGVPFTAAITPDGLLSWGVDPPARRSGNEAAPKSWRMWVTERLAEYLTIAGSAGAGKVEPWQFALERLRLSGIDTDTWVPANAMWPNALATG